MRGRVGGSQRTSEFWESFGGRVSTGLIHATPGEMKSLSSSADRIALIVDDTLYIPETETEIPGHATLENGYGSSLITYDLVQDKTLYL